jgi:hypothetical protein
MRIPIIMGLTGAVGGPGYDYVTFSDSGSVGAHPWLVKQPRATDHDLIPQFAL